MICVLGKGKYIATKTPKYPKMIIFEEGVQYVWVDADDKSAYIQYVPEDENIPRKIVFLGKFRTYEVKDEPGLTNGMHLELFAGKGNWEGFLLPDGFPNDRKKNLIFATDELITKQMG